MPHKKQKRNLRLGVLGMILCMAADWLLDVKPAGNVSSGVVESGWPEMSMWRFEASILTAAAIIPLFWLGIKTLMELIQDRCRTNTDRHMYRLFRAGAMAGTMAFLFVHIMCCLMPIIFKCSMSAGLDLTAASELTNQVGLYIYVPFFAYYIAADLGTSAAWIWLVLKGRLGLPKWASLCCPVVTLVLGWVTHLLPWPASEAGVAFETMGYVLMMAAGLRLCRK